MVTQALLGRTDVERELRLVRGLSLRPVNGMNLRLDQHGSIFTDSDDTSYALTQDARKGLLKHIGLTDKLANELAAANPVLASDVATTMYQTRHADGVFAMQGETPISFARRGTFNVLPVDDVLEGIEEAIGPDVQFNRAMQGRNLVVQLEVVGTHSADVAVGDTIQSGVVIRFNPLGFTNPQVAPYGLRLVCTNGMTARTEYGGGDLPLVGCKDNPVTWIIEQCRSAYENFNCAVDDWREMREHSLHPDTKVATLARALYNAGIKGRQAAVVMDEAAKGPLETEYDILNWITWASSHILENPNTVMHAQDSAVDFTKLATTKGKCLACRQ